MRSISLTAFNRPFYLRRVIDSILGNDTTGFTHCFCGIEPGMVEENIIELHRLESKFEVIPFINRENLGVTRNPFNLLTEVFKAGIDFNLYLEDDSLLSPDAFDFVRYYIDTFNFPDIVCCNLHNYYRSNSEFPEFVEFSQDFSALGVGLSTFQWETWFKPFWFDNAIVKKNRYRLDGEDGWDWSIRAVIKEYDLQVVLPKLSRSYHIGEQGVHSDKKVYDELFLHHPYCQTKHKNFYLDIE